jgi:hypothetical protein
MTACRHTQPSSYFCTTQKLGMVLTCPNGWTKVKRIIVCPNPWKLYRLQIAGSINKVLLKLSHSHQFTFVNGSFHSRAAELTTRTRVDESQRWKYLVFIFTLHHQWPEPLPLPLLMVRCAPYSSLSMFLLNQKQVGNSPSTSPASAVAIALIHTTQAPP